MLGRCMTAMPEAPTQNFNNKSKACNSFGEKHLVSAATDPARRQAVQPEDLSQSLLACVSSNRGFATASPATGEVRRGANSEPGDAGTTYFAGYVMACCSLARRGDPLYVLRRVSDCLDDSSGRVKSV